MPGISTGWLNVTVVFLFHSSARTVGEQIAPRTARQNVAASNLRTELCTDIFVPPDLAAAWVELATYSESIVKGKREPVQFCAAEVNGDRFIICVQRKRYPQQDAAAGSGGNRYGCQRAIEHTGGNA